MITIIGTKHNRTTAEGNGLIAAFDYRENKKVPVPDEWRQRGY
jgi:acyl-CoA thioesterase FadM